MAKERLSRLQKFILTETLKDKGNRIINTRIAEGFWGKEKAHEECIKWHQHHRPHNRGKCIAPQFIASMSRSLHSLMEKGLMEKQYHRGEWRLTDEGKKKAESLMLTSMEINNKKKER